MEQWHRILKKVMAHGQARQDRTGVGTLALFGEQLVFDNCGDTFPAVTAKSLAFGQMAAELACFLRGYRDLADFHRMGCTIWDGNGSAEYWKPRAEFDGDLGRIYGVQWRDWRSVDPAGLETITGRRTDQLKNLVEGIRKEPHGRRHIVTALNPGELDQMCLPPCHTMFQAFVNADNGCIDLAVSMRSVDLFLGLPFDVASYALLQKLLAKEIGLHSGHLIFFLGDAHIYLNHQDQVRTVLARAPYDAPKLVLDPRATLFDFDPKHARLVEYANWGAVPAPLNV